MSLAVAPDVDQAGVLAEALINAGKHPRLVRSRSLRRKQSSFPGAVAM